MTQVQSALSMGRMQADVAASDSGIGRLKEGGDREEIKQVANEFESLFINMVLKSMRNTVQKSGFMDGGHAEEIYRSMLDDEYAKQMAAQRHTGIADQIEDFMLRAQGLKDAVAAAAKAPEAQGLKAYQDAAALQGTPKSETMNGGGSPRRLKAP